MEENRVPTGDEELDSLLSGGFPRKSLISIAGNPGTGKTVFSARFLYRGAANYGENGMYVSFAESRDSFLENMLRFGFDFERLEREGKFKFLDVVTVKESGIGFILERIMSEIRRLNVKRLVIDSFSAMAQAFKEPIEARVVIHLILGKMVRQMGCTTLLISEIPTGEERIGLGMEEFVAEGLILLRTGELDGRLFRDMEIRKMRGTPLPERNVTFTLKDGFKAFQPFTAKPIEMLEGLKTTTDSPERFSTGSKELDLLLGGGYPKGSTVLFEVGDHVSTFQYQLILTPTAWNFIAKGRPIVAIPSSGVDHNVVKRYLSMMKTGLTEDTLRSLLRIFILDPSLSPEEPYIVPFEGKSLQEDYQQLVKIEEELTKETGKPMLHIIGADSLLAYCGEEAAMRALNVEATRVRNRGNLSILIIKAGYARLSKKLGSLVDVHIKIIREHGTLISYGVKPRTGLQVVEAETSKGHFLPRFIPII